MDASSNNTSSRTHQGTGALTASFRRGSSSARETAMTTKTLLAGLQRMRHLLLAPALGLAVLFSASSPVSAAVTLSNGAWASTYISCSQSVGLVAVTVQMNPRSGLATQAVAYRHYMKPLGSAPGAWSPWTTGTAPYYLTHWTSMSNIDFTVYMQYAWWNRGSWTYAGESILTYTQTVQGSGGWTMSYCDT